MFKVYYEFFCLVKIVVGNVVLEYIFYEFCILVVIWFMIIIDKGVCGVGLIDYVFNVFVESGMDIIEIYDDVFLDFFIQVVKDIVKIYCDQYCDLIIVVGGGFVIDISKGVNILVFENSIDLSEFLGVGVLIKLLKLFFVVFIIVGIGFEVILVVVILDLEQGVKLLFMLYFLLFNVVILDLCMMLILLLYIMVMMVMDVMIYVIEFIIGLVSNLISDVYVMLAIKKVSENLIVVLDKLDNVDVCFELVQVLIMVGIVFFNLMVGLVYLLGYFLGVLCYLFYGFCMNLFLFYVLEYNLELCGDVIGELLLLLVGVDVYVAILVVKWFVKIIEMLCDICDEFYLCCKLLCRLLEIGKVFCDQLVWIVEMVLDDGLIIMNLMEVDLSDVMVVLEKVW